LKKNILILILLFSGSAAFSQKTADPTISPYLQYQTALMWKYDDARRKTFDNIVSEKDLYALKSEIKAKVLNMIGGLPQEKTALNPRITGTIQMNGFHIEKLVFESIPGFHVTALVYVPEDRAEKHPAVLVACGHSPVGKIHYQALCQRLVQRGYIVICWDPVGQGERSQFWDENRGQSRYNLVCGEHAVLGNLAYLTGANLMRWEIWDGMRSLDYLMTRQDVDVNRISITGTSGGGAQAAHIGALDERIKVVAPSCYISSLPMRAYNRTFADPDSDPEQDLYGTVSSGVDHAGLLLLVYPRPLFIAAAVLDFFPIEGTRKTFREVSGLYRRFDNGEKIDMVEGYHKHQFSVENQEAAINFMDRFNQLPKREELPPVKELGEKELWSTKKGQVMLEFPDEKSMMDLVKEYFEAHSSTKNTIDYKAGHIEGKITGEKKDQSQLEGVTVDQYIIHHNEHLLMPLRHFHSASGKSNKTVLWVDLNGKAPADIAKRIEKGESVISFDFRGAGADSVIANYVYNSLLMGRSYFLQMIEDTEIASTFARDQLGIREMTLAGTEATGLLLQQIAKVLPNMKRDDNKPALTWSQIVIEKREAWPVQYVLPGGAYVR
jgi:dienelactone hydrolase